MRTRLAWILALGLIPAVPVGTSGGLFMAAAPALAQDNQPDSDRGHALALRWCVACHVVGPGAPGGDAGPTFSSVANRPGQTEQGIRNWLADPHPPMPDLNLATTEFDDLAAYIMSLQE
jgi:mono/diheme cytochrome c family protein